jgi:excisionase family DNA binding protein
LEETLNKKEIVEPEVLLPEEVAKILRINVQTVLIKLKKKELKGFKVGSYWRINKADLDKYRGLRRAYEAEGDGE